ncbi:YdcF family protein [Clostridium sp. DSM 100503]|uniref:YdcF family protein n=1 Tax=Clostridium sp. DSM 100503 TaxID=2963282 RepID=UPI00214A5768|nr:YdcF family protein [Clostridium sp. DSM 100503]MCR1950315.1 YdcF family protein [Clostridium sp. DSM 100503]
MIKKIDLIIGIFIVIYSISINLIFGKISFSEVFLGIGIILIIYHYTKEKMKQFINRRKSIKGMFNIIRYFITIILLIFIIIESAIVIFPKNNKIYSDYVIVLGAGIKGEKPSLTLMQRLDKAIEYVNNQDKEVQIIVSGGQGRGEDISEAQAMKKYLVDNGIKEESIIMEDKSTSTNENLIFSKEVLEDCTKKNIVDINVKIITSDFHAFRSNMIAKKLGYSNISFYTNSTLPVLIPVMYSREFLAIIKSYLIDIKK